MRALWWSWGLVFLLVAQVGEGSKAPSVILFSPQGVVKKVAQVRVGFSDEMVAFGEPAQSEPVTWKCMPKGKGRWIDPKNWVYDFADGPLPAGVGCRFELKPELKTLDGREVSGTRSFLFSTGGPAVEEIFPYNTYTGIVEEQIFAIRADAPLNVASVESGVHFEVAGIKEKVGAQVYAGGEKKKILHVIGWKDEPNVVLVKAKQSFPNSAAVKLVWGKGILSESGVPSTGEEKFGYAVRDEFRLKFSCERENPKANCSPLSSFTLDFTSPVARSSAAGITLKSSKGQVWRAQIGDDTQSTLSYLKFAGPLPEQETFTISIPKSMKDEEGRPLVNANKYPLTVKTAGFPPLAKFAGSFGIIEAKEGAVLPVTVRNLEKSISSKLLKSGDFSKVEGNSLRIGVDNVKSIFGWMKRLKQIEREDSIFKATRPYSAVNGSGANSPPPYDPIPSGKPTAFELPRKLGENAFEVVGIPLKDPGFYVVELESQNLGASLTGKNQPVFVSTAALVTDLAVHFKWSSEVSLAWVTRLSDGKPVAEASVSVVDCSGTPHFSGKTKKDGTLQIIGLPKSQEVQSCKSENYGEWKSGLLVVASLGNDFSFVHSSWNDGIEPWRFQIPTYESEEGAVAHAVLDRSLLRAGDTVHMKLFLRRQVSAGFAQVPEQKRPGFLQITHEGEGQNYGMKIQWAADGTADAEWKVPKEAKLGQYSMRLLMASKVLYPWWGVGGFRVEEFRVPLMRGSLQPPKDPLVAVTKAPFDFSVSYLSGGGASQLPIQIRGAVREEGSIAFPDYDDFTFAQGLLQPGTKTRSNDGSEETEEGASPVSGAGSVALKTLTATLDKAGTGRETVSGIPLSKKVQQLVTELEYQDANGEKQTISNVSRVYPTSHLAGVKVDSWSVSKDDLKFQVVVVDARGKPVLNALVEVELLERKSFSNRKRLVGGFYSYEHTEEIKPVGSICKGKTEANGRFHCQGKSPISGNLIVQVRTTDPEGRVGGTYTDIWVAGDKDWWFQVSDNDRMDLLADQKRYQPGQTAKLQVRMPFREATALVTVEREGVIESFVLTLSGKYPIVEVPIKGEFSPNVFVSVLAVRGRVGDVKPTALVDLGRPSFKLGLTELKVGWKAHALKVKVETAREVFKVREKIPVHIAVTTATGEKLPAGSEVILAAVDEGLLELMPNRSWNLLEAMMSPRPDSVTTYTAQMFVVGKRHFGLKALPPGGGGGGGQSTRELFDTLLLWKSTVKLDANGEAEVEVPLNDSITSFRLTAIAHSGVGLFGTGSTTIRTSQDLMLFAGVAPVARSGDDVQSRFTLRNTTSAPMKVEVRLKVDGIKAALKPQTIPLGPGESKEVAWNVEIPTGVESLVYEVEANDESAGRDRLKVTQKVLPSVPVRTYQATLLSLDKPQSMAIETPSGAMAGQGGIHSILSPSLAGSLSGVADYMKDYPYTCFEQQVSRAVATGDEKAWRRLMEKLPSYQDSVGLIKYFPNLLEGSSALTAYVLSISDEAGWAMPQEGFLKARNGLKAFVAGTVTRTSEIGAPDLSLRKVSALEALTRRADESKEVNATLLSSFSLSPNSLPTSTLIEWLLVMRRLDGVQDREKRVAETEQMLRSRLNFRGTSMGFSTEKNDVLSWLMVSIDSNAARLLLAALPLSGWKEDVPRIAKGLIARQVKGHWDLTTANAWGALAIRKFQTAFEKQPVSGMTTADLGGVKKSTDWKSKPNGETLFFPWPASRVQLAVRHSGTGAPWLTVQSRAAIPLKEKREAGFQIEKTMRAVERKDASTWTAGDIVRVTLKLKAQADLPWVVVDDPIPAGASLLGTGLGRDSALATAGEKNEGGAYPAFQEKAFDGLRSYYQYVPRGEWVLEYTMRLNASGRFELPPTRVEAMYEPDLFAESPNPAWQIR